MSGATLKDLYNVKMVDVDAVVNLKECYIVYDNSLSSNKQVSFIYDDADIAQFVARELSTMKGMKFSVLHVNGPAILYAKGSVNRVARWMLSHECECRGCGRKCGKFFDGKNYTVVEYLTNSIGELTEH